MVYSPFRVMVLELIEERRIDWFYGWWEGLYNYGSPPAWVSTIATMRGITTERIEVRRCWSNSNNTREWLPPDLILEQKFKEKERGYSERDFNLRRKRIYFRQHFFRHARTFSTVLHQMDSIWIAGKQRTRRRNTPSIQWDSRASQPWGHGFFSLFL